MTRHPDIYNPFPPTPSHSYLSSSATPPLPKLQVPADPKTLHVPPLWSATSCASASQLSPAIHSLHSPPTP
ncbi:hypothetical protein BKA81DRAFT_85252 [Phyllosticta paracitricarpa]